jgi:DNA-binding NtrC family response regulator
LSGQRILIVDDEEAILSAMKDYLESFDWEVDCARDVDEARRLLSGESYSVVIADLRLSPTQAIGGLDLITYVREQHPATRTVLLTAYGSSQVEQEARRLGVDAFLHKPQPLAEIIKIVYGVVGQSGKA